MTFTKINVVELLTEFADRLRIHIEQLERQEFYGSVELKFEAGRIVLIRKTETIKPNDHRNNRGANNERA